MTILLTGVRNNNILTFTILTTFLEGHESISTVILWKILTFYSPLRRIKSRDMRISIYIPNLHV
jgi:hypothetical protein